LSLSPPSEVNWPMFSSDCASAWALRNSQSDSCGVKMLIAPKRLRYTDFKFWHWQWQSNMTH